MGELEEKETSPTESTPQQDVAEEPKETDRMLEKKTDKAASSPVSDKKKAAATSSKPTTPNGEKKPSSPTTPPTVQSDAAGDAKKSPANEEIIDIPEVGEEKKISTEDREVKPKKIPIGGLKLPGFFMNSKPKGGGDGDGADGELLEKEPKDEAATTPAGDAAAKAKAKEEEAAKPRPNFGERLRNFFVRKPADKQQPPQSGKTPANGDADAKSEATAEASAGEGGNDNDATTAAPPQKRGLLNAIKLPIANMIPKKRNDDDVEMGLGGGKAGLASMETLDDSLKDQDCVDKAPAKNNGNDDLAKLKKSASGADLKQNDEKSPDSDEVPVSLMQRLRSYRCSVDDALIALGILLFVLLIAVIGYVLSHETLTAPKIREGRYMDAVTTCGMVEGLKEDGAFAFRGIPYAVPPVGEQRWQPTKPIEGIDACWNGTLQAHNSSALCTQRLSNGTIVGDEDCLYLDVVTPHVRYDNPLPVIVLIGAESLTGPSPGVLRPSARYSRSHDVIFVRPNFRMGAFGFLAVEALTKDAYPRTSGNYALTDIITALKWINMNILHFGGDPQSVTLLGHRAGATLVAALVTSKQLDGLYTRAWISSAATVFPGKPLPDSEKRNEEFMQALDCQNVTCMRESSVEKIWSATPDTWLPFPADIPATSEESSSAGGKHEWLVLDGVVLQQHPTDALKEEQNGQPKLVIGSTAHESHTDNLRQRHANWTAEEVRSYVEASKIGALNLTNEVVSRYNATNYRALVGLITDIRTICPLLTMARLQPTVPFYVVTQGEGEDQLATVDADVQAILGRYEPHTVEQRRFVSSMQQLFYYFVSHGTVPQFDPRRRVLNVGQDPIAHEDHANCNFWIHNDIVPRFARVD